MKPERSVLMLSTVVALLMGAIALAAGIATGSGAILLDGAFNLCFFATALVTLRVARMLERPDYARYPFGYFQFEPLINMVKGLLILGVGLIALALQRAGREPAARLVDPILVGLVVILTIGVPIRMAVRGLMALVNRAPDEQVVTEIETLVRSATTDLSPRDLFVRVVRPGRPTYALVHILLADAQAGVTVREADAWRRAIISAVVGRYAPVIVDIVFTFVREFAEPTTGFAGGFRPKAVPTFDARRGSIDLPREKERSGSDHPDQ
jgi:predicted Co/Zn/Cd cation transporter (cation efflux family)